MHPVLVRRAAAPLRLALAVLFPLFRPSDQALAYRLSVSAAHPNGAAVPPGRASSQPVCLLLFKSASFGGQLFALRLELLLQLLKIRLLILSDSRTEEHRTRYADSRYDFLGTLIHRSPDPP